LKSGEEKRIGEHQLSLGGDLLLLELGPYIGSGEIGAMAKEADETLLELGHLFVLCDVSRVSGASRHINAELRGRPKHLPAHFVVYVGAPFKLRVILDLIIRASRLLTGAQITHRFFDTREEGRAWLVERGARTE